MKKPGKRKKDRKEKKASKAAEAASHEPEEDPEDAGPPAVWQPGMDVVPEGESLQYDPTVYDCLHQLTFEWPCLSFDIVRDGLGGPRRAFPHDMLVAAGTQAARANANYIALMRLSNLGQGEHAKAAEDDDGLDMDDSDEEDKDPARLHTVKVPTGAGLNRVRGMPQAPGVVAAWCDNGRVQVWDFSAQFQQLADKQGEQGDSHSHASVQPLHSHAHRDEGYALDWSRAAPGRLAAGDCARAIHVWEPGQAGTWTVSSAYKGHTASVEDIQWSPCETTVLASGSVDRTIRIWDTRDRSKPQLTVPAHDADVNVVSWNALTPHTLASGGDDGRLRVWDLRSFRAPVADFGYHRKAVTSVEWSPHESAVLLTTSEDNALGIWDLALERDPEEELQLGMKANARAPEDLPPQLLFVHAGQTDMKEAHWHPQIPGLVASTAADGVHVFKPYNVAELPSRAAEFDIDD